MSKRRWGAYLVCRGCAHKRAAMTAIRKAGGILIELTDGYDDVLVQPVGLNLVPGRRLYGAEADELLDCHFTNESREMVQQARESIGLAGD